MIVFTPCGCRLDVDSRTNSALFLYVCEEHNGKQLRDQLAGDALVALGDHQAVEARGIPWLVQHAYMVADAMLEQRGKK